MMIKKQHYAFIILTLLNLKTYAAEFSVFEDLLYWHASQQATSIWAYQFSLKSTGDSTDPANQGTYFSEPNTYFDWDPGLRVGLHFTPSQSVDTKIYWTHFDTKTNESLNAPSEQLLLPQFFNGFTTTSVYNSAHLSWRIQMNMVDAKIGYYFSPLDSLTLHPSFGIKGGAINQTLESSWQMAIFNIPLYDATESLKNNFAGAGPSISLDGLWQIYKNVSLQSDLEAALLWGRWKITDDFHRPNSLFYAEKTIESDTHDTLGTFMTRYFLGLSWRFETATEVTLRVGYEMQFWSNQLRLPLFQALPVHGDLTLQGGTCGIYITL